MSNPTQDVLSLASFPMPVTQDVAGSSPVHPATFYKVEPQASEGFPSVEPEGFFVGKESGKASEKRQSSTKVQHAKVQHVGVFLSVKEVAARLGVTSITVTRWCESGKLPAIAKPYGKKTTYQTDQPKCFRTVAGGSKVGTGSYSES